MKSELYDWPKTFGSPVYISSSNRSSSNLCYAYGFCWLMLVIFLYAESLFAVALKSKGPDFSSGSLTEELLDYSIFCPRA